MPSSKAPESPADDDAADTPAQTGSSKSASSPSAKSSASKVKQTRARAKSAKDGAPKIQKANAGNNPPWLVPLMLVLLLGGLVWVVVYYLTSGTWAWPTGNWNIAYGFALILAGGILSTRYK